MNGWTISSALVLVAGVGVTWLSVVGLIRCRDAFDRLHFSGLAAIYGPMAIAVSLCLAEGIDGSSPLRAWLIAAVLIPTSGVLAHATARAEFWRLEGSSAHSPDGEEAHHELA